MVTYLESVPAPEGSDETQDPTVDNPKRPPSAEEWYDAGYAPGTYEPRFAGKEWLPCWSDPSYVPKHKSPAEIAAAMGRPLQTSLPLDETEVAPPVGPSVVDVDDEPTQAP